MAPLNYVLHAFVWWNAQRNAIISLYKIFALTTVCDSDPTLIEYWLNVGILCDSTFPQQHMDYIKKQHWVNVRCNGWTAKLSHSYMSLEIILFWSHTAYLSAKQKGGNCSLEMQAGTAFWLCPQYKSRRNQTDADYWQVSREIPVEYVHHTPD